MKRLFILALAFLTVSTVAGFRVSSSAPNPQASVSVHLLLGNPSGATTNQTNSDNLLLVKPRFALSYNKSKGTPNWVSWHIDMSELGRFTRTQIGNPFVVDTSLPVSWRIRPTDYHFSETGMQRGHMCPSADRNRTIARARSTFVMSNMVPQIKELNEEIWGDLEAYERDLVRDEGNEVYIVAGCSGSKGMIRDRVNIPEKCWKIIVVLTAATSNDLARINANTRVIAAQMPNTASLIGNKKWFDFRTTVDAIEAETGFDFLSEVSASIQAVIEARKDTVAIN